MIKYRRDYVYGPSLFSIPIIRNNNKSPVGSTVRRGTRIGDPHPSRWPIGWVGEEPGARRRVREPNTNRRVGY